MKEINILTIIILLIIGYCYCKSLKMINPTEVNFHLSWKSIDFTFKKEGNINNKNYAKRKKSRNKKRRNNAPQKH